MTSWLRMRRVESSWWVEASDLSWASFESSEDNDNCLVTFR